jgi:hypothetical protein
MDITFNDFNYRHINAMEIKIKENNVKYKAAAMERYKKEIEVLNLDREKLVATEEKLGNSIKMKGEADERLAEKMRALELAEQARKEKVKEMKDFIVEETKTISKTEQKALALSHEASKIRTEKETKYWNLVQKLHKEKDANNRLEKRIRAKKQQVEEHKLKGEKEIQALQEQLKIKQFDHHQAQQELQAVEDLLTKTKNSVNEATRELTEDPSAVGSRSFLKRGTTSSSSSKTPRLPPVKSR